MTSQIYILIAFFITGICIGLLFDIFRVSRKAFKTPNILIYIEDVLFWILTGLIILFTIFTFTTGEIRFYMILTMLFACFIYFISISKYFIMINTKIINFFKSIIHFLLKPFKKIFNLLHILKKNLLNFTKSSGKWRILCYNVEIDI